MQMIIGGKHVDASNGKTSQVVNPATGQVIDTVPEATLEDLDRAIGLAVEGQKEWNAIPLHQRLAILETYCQLLTREETVEKIARVMCEQGGKLLCGGKRSGAFVEPTVIEVTPEMDIARDMEVFGPVWPVIPFDTLEEALEIANNTIFGRSSGVITSLSLIHILGCAFLGGLSIRRAGSGGQAGEGFFLRKRRDWREKRLAP